ncbi:MAG: amidophosphoribosyltransferase [Deltaproteobacteria bacterium]|nr:amidophosphoribosyltransferase [Deltaproteobacteria bacterium]
MFDKFNEECALVGVWNHLEAANIAYLGLHAQQHRGQAGAGVVSLENGERARFYAHRGQGLVADVFNDFDFSRLPGRAAIGHVRYTTAETASLANVQPLQAEISMGCVAIAHNGNLINAAELREKLIGDGAIFGATTDTEIFLHLLARSPKNVPKVETIITALEQVHGAYSLLVMYGDRLFALRDAYGIRPLCLGKLDGGWIVASETCAFDLIGADYVREIEAGEVLELSMDGKVKSYFPFGMAKERPCVFEYVYFARPDSLVFGRNVYAVRKRMGRELAKELPVEADYVIPVPDSGVPAALGYSQESGIPFEFGLIRNHYVGRTFIEPKQAIRDFGVKIKLNPNSDLLDGKSIVVVDDSIVRGTTCRKLVKMLRQAGARQIHLRVSAPPTIDPCFYGIDTPQKSDLIAANKSVEEIKEYLGADSLVYLSMEGLYRAINSDKTSFCDACFSGKYPISVGKPRSHKQQELFNV